MAAAGITFFPQHGDAPVMRLSVNPGTEYGTPFGVLTLGEYGHEVALHFTSPDEAVGWLETQLAEARLALMALTEGVPG